MEHFRNHHEHKVLVAHCAKGTMRWWLKEPPPHQITIRQRRIYPGCIAAGSVATLSPHAPHCGAFYISYKYLFQISLSNISYKFSFYLFLQIFLINISYKYLFQISLTIISYKYLLQISLTNFSYKYLLQISLTNISYKYLLQISLTNISYKFSFSLWGARKSNFHPTTSTECSWLIVPKEQWGGGSKSHHARLDCKAIELRTQCAVDTVRSRHSAQSTQCAVGDGRTAEFFISYTKYY